MIVTIMKAPDMVCPARPGHSTSRCLGKWCMAWRVVGEPLLLCRTELSIARAAELTESPVPPCDGDGLVSDAWIGGTVDLLVARTKEGANPFPSPWINADLGKKHHFKPKGDPFFDEDDYLFAQLWERSEDPEETGYCGLAGKPREVE